MVPGIVINRSFSFDEINILHSTGRWEPSTELASLVDERWDKQFKELTSRGVELWDGDLYRVDNLEELIKADGAAPLKLRLSTIKYRYASTYKELTDDYVRLNESPPIYSSIVSLILTSDNKFVFGKRSKFNVNSFQTDLIGGLLQRDELEINVGVDLYRTLLKEMHEEVGIEESNIESSKGIGIIQSKNSNVIFIAGTRLKINSQEMQQVFANRTAEEMQEIVFVEPSRLVKTLSELGGYRKLIPKLLHSNWGWAPI